MEIAVDYQDSSMDEIRIARIYSRNNYSSNNDDNFNM